MNKVLKGILCTALCCTTVTVTGVTAGCKKGKLDTETRPLQLSIGALDQNFNPFYSSTLQDSKIANMTQISMFTTDSAGEVACGENEATVALDYTTKYYDTRQVGTGTQVNNGTMDGRTEYDILIKNGIKYSDGSDLTIKDVLFNLYVYLDPVYTGSSTVYSTNIQGLNAYREQDRNVSDDGEISSNSSFYADAQTRLDALYNWSEDPQHYAELDEQGEKDLKRVKELFLEEINSDWSSQETSWQDSYEEEYNFTQAWQAYLFAEGIIGEQTRTLNDGSIERIKGADGKYLTTLDAYVQGAGIVGTVGAQANIDAIAELTTDAKINEYVSAHNCTADYAYLQITKEYCVDLVYETYTSRTSIRDLVTVWATASNALTEFAMDERTTYFASVSDPVESISGITTYKTSTFNGKDLDGEHDVLKVVINGVDPKAIWNLSIPIAPMHYYSGTYQGVDYVAKAESGEGFGVKMGDINFYNEVLRATNKNGLPVGAGAYMASDDNGGAATSRAEFLKNNIVYFERNPYFETVGSGISNAKIKYLRYKVYPDSSVFSALQTQEIDYGEPNAKREQLGLVQGNDFMSYTHYANAGYGYVGINPKYVPDMEVRQAIMMAMDTSSIINNYYSTTLGEVIYRPMSTTSWAYPKGCTEYPDIAFTTDVDKIKEKVESAGYALGNDGLYVKNGKKLEYDFTIAGESRDHPAYNMFTTAATTLNSIGFKITVRTDLQALKKLSSGNLAVWAAAWTSGVDPDMYQVYHKDSMATSVYNWGYREILNGNPGDGWDDEREIINLLSDEIMEARQTTSQTERIEKYSTCLNYVMQLAVELPTYQRHDLCVYNNKVIDKNSLNPNPNDKIGLIDEIWKVDYVK